MPGPNYTLAIQLNDGRTLTMMMNENNLLKSFKIEDTTYDFQHELGRGTHAIVEAFHDKTNNKTIAVKRPIRFFTQGVDDNRLDDANSEFKYATKVLKGRGLLHLAFFPLEKLTPDGKKQFGYCMFLPYIEGQRLADRLHNATSYQQILKIYLAAALELERLHQTLKVVHGDVHAANFIVDDDCNATAIDFMLTRDIGIRPAFVLTPPPAGDTVHKYAPERWVVTKNSYTHPSQDVWGYAVMIQLGYTYNSHWIDDSLDKRSYSQNMYYPNEFMMLAQQGLTATPEQRPSMTDFVNVLMKNMTAYPPRPITIINFPLSFESMIMKYGQHILHAGTNFKSHSGADNLTFPSPYGILRVKFAKNDIRPELFEGLLFQRKLYPQFEEQFQLYSLEDFHGFTWTHDYKYVEISPELSGVTYEESKLENKSELEIARIHLTIFKEVQRMYDLGILHGNLKGSNILIDDKNLNNPKCYLTKFNWSYRLNAPLARTANCAGLTGINWAPERRVRSLLTPAIEQDIFSLGFALLFKLQMMKADVNIPTFKIINDFALDAIYDDPIDRPNSLHATIDALTNRIEALIAEEKILNPEPIVTPVLSPLKAKKPGTFSSLRLFDCNKQQEISTNVKDPELIQVKTKYQNNEIKLPDEANNIVVIKKPGFFCGKKNSDEQKTSSSGISKWLCCFR